MKKFLLGILVTFLTVLPAFSKDKAYEPNYIYDELLNAGNYKIIDYNYPAGSRELNLFGLKNIRQFNRNAVASPDFEYLAYSEVYFFPETRVTASALYLIPLKGQASKVDAILSVSTKDKLPQPIIETNYATLYPFRFNTYTPVDWDSTSNKILFKEKLGQNYYTVFTTNLYLYDLSQDKMYNLNVVKQRIIDFWAKRNVHLEDYKWDIKPLGFSAKNQNEIFVNAYGYYKDERRFLGTWVVDVYGQRTYMKTMKEGEELPVLANGKCLKFLPDIRDVYMKQREINAKKFEINIVPK